jgi:hypothetical protein
MNRPARPPRRGADRDARWRSWLAVGGVGLVAVTLVGLWVETGVGGFLRGSPPPAPIIYTGMGIQTTAPFYLAGGTYRTQWSAWERAPEYPPCTHSAELMAVDPANATGSQGHVIELARLVQVPATGASDEGFVINVKPGQYFFEVNSECAWQIAITPN